MTADHSLGLRRALVTALRADAGILAIVGARVYGEAVPATPTWPYINVGVIVAGEYDATCLDGIDASFAVHSFDKAKDAQGAYGLNALVAIALNGTVLTFDTAHIVSLDWSDSQVVRDTGEASAWHGIAQFRAKTSEDY